LAVAITVAKPKEKAKGYLVDSGYQKKFKRSAIAQG